MTKNSVSTIKNGSNIYIYIYIEFLRVLASFFVVYLHTGNYAAWNFNLLPVLSVQFPFQLCFSVLAKIAVPLFFMVSGSLLLGKEESIGVVMKKRVWKYAKLIAVFSLINYIIDNCILEKKAFSITAFATNLVTGNVPIAYWFLYVMLALMILLPFLRSIARQMTYNQFKYLVVIALSISFVFKLMNRFWLSEMSLCIDDTFTEVFPTEDLLYFLIGYGIVKFVDVENRPKRDIIVIGVLWAASILAMAFLTVVYSIREDAWTSWTYAEFTESLTVITAGSTLCLTRYFMRNIKQNGILAKTITLWGGASVGVVLFEGLMRKLFFVDVVEFLGKYMPVFVAGCISALLVCIVCSVIAGIIQRTPVLKKLL